MGDPNTPEGLQQITRQSPLSHADKIKTPLMIVQGANDPRVNKAEADQIVVALRDRKYPVQYLLADDEGHGFARPVNNMAMFAASEKFLAKYLGGRFQESMSPEVAKRLAELTVDPTTVSLTKTAAKPDNAAVDLAGGWSMLADAGSQQIPMTVQFKQDGLAFSGTSSSHLGQGSILDGKISGDSFTALMKADINGQTVDFTIIGKVVGDTMNGTFSNPAIGQIPFTGTRNK
jgi:hypothetical protein